MSFLSFLLGISKLAWEQQTQFSEAHKNFLLSIHCKENKELVITPSSPWKVGFCEAAPCFKSGWDPTAIFCLLLLYLSLQHCSYFIDLIKPLLAMKVQQKIYSRTKGKHPNASGQYLRGSWQKAKASGREMFFLFAEFRTWWSRSIFYRSEAWEWFFSPFKKTL